MSESAVEFIGDYFPPVKPGKRHCVDCLTNPVMPEPEDAAEPMRRCEPCQFKHERRLAGAKRALWRDSSWPVDS